MGTYARLKDRTAIYDINIFAFAKDVLQNIFSNLIFFIFLIKIVTVVFDYKTPTTKKYLVWIFLFQMASFLEVHETEIKEMFGVADHDNNGHIGFKEFMVRPFFILKGTVSRGFFHKSSSPKPPNITVE
jgi:hypothetical protein